MIHNSKINHISPCILITFNHIFPNKITFVSPHKVNKFFLKSYLNSPAQVFKDKWILSLNSNRSHIVSSHQSIDIWFLQVTAGWILTFGSSGERNRTNLFFLFTWLWSEACDWTSRSEVVSLIRKCCRNVSMRKYFARVLMTIFHKV